MTHICVSKITIIASDNGLPSHYLNQCWNIVNWTLGNKLQWNFNQNSNIFIQENAFENGVCEMASICLGLNELSNVYTACMVTAFRLLNGLREWWCGLGRVSDITGILDDIHHMLGASLVMEIKLCILIARPPFSILENNEIHCLIGLMDLQISSLYRDAVLMDWSIWMRVIRDWIVIILILSCNKVMFRLGL